MALLRSVALLLIVGPFLSAADPPSADSKLADSKSATAYLERGEQLRLAGQFDDAIRQLDEALRLDPAHPAAYASRGICWERKGDLKRALADLNVAILLDSKNPEFFRGRIAVWYAMQDWPRAIEDLDRAVKLRPDDPTLYEDRALVWAKQLEWRRAATDCGIAVQLAPQSVKAWKLRGAVMYKLGQDDEALAAFDKVIELDPLNVEVRNLIVETLWQAQKWEQVVRVCEKAKRLNASTAELCTKCGGARQLSAGRDYSRALQDFDDALRLDSAYVPALRARAVLRAACPDEQVRDAAKAEVDARRAWELTGGRDGCAISVFAVARAAAGRYEDAVKYQKQALEDSAYVAAYGDGARTLLKLFEQGKPYRLPTK